MNNQFKILIIMLVCLAFLVNSAGAQTMATYSWQPPVVSDSSKPNTMILLSNDWTGFTKGYKSDNNYDDDEEYWGYFDADKYYEMGNKYFEPVGYVQPGTHYVPVAAGNSYWSGNFLNWVTMSNVDFLRKALTGGAREADAVGSSTLLRGLIGAGEDWKKNYTGFDLNRLVPSAYNNPDYEFYNVGETFTVRDKNTTSTIGGPFTVEVLVCVQGLLEENCRDYPSVGEAKPEGLLHKYADKMRFALMTYSHALPDQGGVLRKKMGSVSDEWSANNGQQNQGTNDTMIRYIENYTRKGWDPLAEMYFDAIRYFKGNKGGSDAYCNTGKNFTSDDSFPVYGCESNKDWGDDPIIDWCQKNNIIIMNDEYPSREHDSLPGSSFNPGYSVNSFGDARPYNIDVSQWTNIVGDWEKTHGTTSSNWYVGNILGGVEDADCSLPKNVTDLSKVHGICPTEPTAGSRGTFYLAGIAHHAFTHDLRTDLEGTQNIRTWTLAYRATSASTYSPPAPPMNQMWMAAKYGNFNDVVDVNGKPDAGEWADPDRTDKNGKPLPFAYFPADNGKELVDAIGKIFDAILETTASGTAVSVLANSGQGEGNLVQAYYRPRLSQGEASVNWVGFLQSLWIDSDGFIREDTNENNQLELHLDKVVKYVETGGTTKARLYDVSLTNPTPKLETDPYTEVELEEVKVLWDAGRELARTNPNKRKIFTFIDKNQDQIIEERLALNPDTDMFNDTGEVISFYDRNYRALMPYLNVKDDALDSYLGRSQKIRALNLVRWVQGYDPEVDSSRFVDRRNVAARKRHLGGTDVFKLGDIINSTPVTIGSPPDIYHVIYSDETYQKFYNKYKNRETVVYVGGNDGMLHAVTAWKFIPSTGPGTFSKFVDPDTSTTEEIGSEIWAYIPKNLLPHLKWQAREDYSHVYYLDSQPRIFDARIFTKEMNDPDGKHPYGWGTIMVVGYGIGGGSIWVQDRFDDGSSNYVDQTRTFNPSFFAIDITDPQEPELLWDRSYTGLGMSMSFPTIVRVDNDTNDDGVWFLVFGSGPDAGDRSMPVPPQYDGESLDKGYFYAVDILTGQPYQDASSNDYLFETVETNAFMGPPVSFDKDLDFEVDAVYIPVTYDAGTSANHDWKGSVYKVTIPVNGAGHSETPLGKAGLNPDDPWHFHKLFDSPRPITAAPSLSVDEDNNTWVYFGTGRMFEGEDDPNADFGSSETEYLYGIKDPFYNINDSTHYKDYSVWRTISSDMSLSPPELFDADPILVLDTGRVYEESGGTYSLFGTTGFWNEMVDTADTFDGWRRSLRTAVDSTGTTRTMRSLNKPAVIGGLALFSTFMPTGNTCSFGGESDLNILYYKTGTAFKRAVARGTGSTNSIDIDGDGTDETQIKDAISLGSGTTSSVGIHIGTQNQRASASGDNPEGDLVTGFVQQGTGKVVELDIETAIKIRSGLRGWREK